MTKNKNYIKIMISAISLLVLTTIISSAYIIYPNSKNIQDEVAVTTGAISMLSSEGYEISTLKTNSSYLEQKTLDLFLNSTTPVAELIIKDTPFKISFKCKLPNAKETNLPENILKCRKNGFYSTKNPEIEEKYNNIPSNETIKVWVGFEEPIPFSEYEKVIYYIDYNSILQHSTAFKSSDNLDDTAIHLRARRNGSHLKFFSYSGYDLSCDYCTDDLLPKESLDYFMNLSKKDTKYLEKLLNSELFKGVNVDFEKSYQYIKDNNYDVAGYCILTTKDEVDEKLKALPNSFVVDFFIPGKDS